MDSVGVNVIETAALGRPFQLGMLYDCRKDALVPGITLWDQEKLQESTRARPQINTDFKVTASDSTEEKIKVLNIDGRLELSFLGGLISVSGAAKFLNDTKKSFKQQRLTLHYHSTSKFEELTMNHLASGNISHHEVFDNDAATHVVTAVLYGADACFVFDREVSSDENINTVAGEVKAVFDKLKGISVDGNIDLSKNEKQKTAFQKFSCTFYGDFQLQSNPASLEDALKVYAELPKMLGERKELAVPLRVWLYPLDKLHTRSAKLQNDISIGLIKDTESVIESLNTTEMKCSDLLSDSATLTFAAFHGKIQQMRQNCHNYKLCVIKNLGSLLPKIRGDLEKETALIDLLHHHEESPFRGDDLEQWLKGKENECAVIKTLLRQLKDSGAKVEINRDTSLMDLEVENLVCYTFTSFEWPDVLLYKQKVYLNPSSKRNSDECFPNSTQETWLTSDIKTSMRNNLKIFKNLMDSKDRKPAKFIVSSKEMEKHPGSCILLYENGCDEAICFNPPSKPAHPITEQIRDDSVVLKVPPSCSNTAELRFLYKTKEEKDWKSHPVQQNQDTVTLTDLRSDIEYEVKCAAVGKLNYTVDGDVIHLRVINKNIIRATESLIENLSLTESKCSKLLEESRAVTFNTFQKKIADMRRFCQTYKQDFNAKIQSSIKSVQACKMEMCALTDALQAHEESPFNKRALEDWITVKETEVSTTDEILQNLLDTGAEVLKNIDEHLSDLKVNSLVCYTFSSLEQPDGLLSEQEQYLKSQVVSRNVEKTPYATSQTCLTVRNKEKMRERLKTFQELMALNSNESIQFMVSSKDHQKHPGSCILLYENGCDEAICFNPPSKPAHPITEQIRDDGVVLKVPPSCSNTVELRFLYKTKEEKDWKSHPVQQNQDTVTLTDLRSDIEYEVKCAAVGKLNYTVDSDVITVITKMDAPAVEKFGIITEEEIKELNEIISNQDISSASNTIKKYLEKQVLVELNIGVTGESGSGKSKFVNAFRGLGDEDEDSAETGVVETTMEPKAYPHPKYPNVKVWDLPGIGTPNFKADEYLQQVQLERYDFFIIIASDRFRECHTQLAKEITRMEKKFYFVRSKIDVSIDGEKNKKTFDQEKLLDKVRENCISGLKGIDGIDDPVVFLISSCDLGKYDFNLLQERMEKELPQHKRHVLILSLPNITLEVNEKKKESLRRNVLKVSLLSAGVAAVPVPGLSIAVDSNIIVHEIRKYFSVFGLDNKSLIKLSEQSGQSIETLEGLITSVWYKVSLTGSVLYTLCDASLFLAEVAVERVFSFIPIVGSLVAGALSFATVYFLLNKALNDIAEDARKVLMAAVKASD